MEIIKQAPSLRADDDPEVVRRVTEIINNIRQEGETAVRRLARELDDWEQDFVLSDEKRTALISQVSEQTKTDLQFAWHQIKRFAQAQMDSLTEFEIETEPGVTLGQRLVPVGAAGCYVPGGRYAHAASALMSITTAKTAGVSKIIACSPPRGESIHPAVVYAMDLAGADVILELGGVQAIATMAFGLFDQQAVDMLVGPGNHMSPRRSGCYLVKSALMCWLDPLNPQSLLMRVRIRWLLRLIWSRKPSMVRTLRFG